MLPDQLPFQCPDPTEDAVQAPLHLHQGPHVMQEVFDHLLKSGTGQVEVHDHHVALLKVVQHVLLGQDDGVDLTNIHHAQDVAAEDPQGLAERFISSSSSTACTFGSFAHTSRMACVFSLL